MDEKLKATINKVVQLTKQNSEFDNELRKALGMGSSAKSVLDRDVSHNIVAIRSYLEIRGDKSINYDFIKEMRLRDQLIIDNLRMENASLNLTEKENTRFYAFCVNAFYQVENIINYYYHKTYPQIDALLEEIETRTAEGKYPFKRKGNGIETTVADIPSAYKISAFCHTFFPDDTINYTLSDLRKVRNEGEHRCDVILNKKDDKELIYRFFKYNSFNSIRIVLIKLVKEVEKQLSITSIPQIEICEIKVLLPSACFISLKGENIQVPNHLFNKVKNKKTGDIIKISLKNNTIVDVL